MVWLVLVSVAVPFLISVGLTAWVRGWALRQGFVDQPGGRKGHAGPVALGGGLAIFWAVVLPIGIGLVGAGMVAWRSPPALLVGVVEDLRGEGTFAPLLAGLIGKLPAGLAILGGAAAIHSLGLIDDRRRLGPLPKLVVEFSVAGVLVVGFGLRAAEFLGPVLCSVVSILWLVAIINAMNFLDNMDGLAAGVAVIAAGVLAATATRAGQLFVPVLTWAVLGAVAGFLPYNLSPASIFMGDAGSLLVGYFLGVLTILTTYYDPRLQLAPYGFFLPVVVLAVPLYDMVTVLWHRWRAGAGLFVADRRHFSHRLVARGMQPRFAVLTVWLAAAATALPAMLLPGATWPAAVVIFAQCLCILLLVAVLEHAGSHAIGT